MKRIIAFALVLLIVFALFGCEGVKDKNDTSLSNVSSSTTTPPSSDDTTTSSSDGSTSDSSTSTPGEDIPGEDENEREFKVYLRYNGKPFIERGIEPIQVTWNDGVSYFTSGANDEGVASVKGLDGDYVVSVSNLPEGYTYNPNVNFASNNEPEIIVQIYKLGKSSGAGTDEYNTKMIHDVGVYRTSLRNEGHKVFFTFVPKGSGTYTIESWISVDDDRINPKIDVYSGSSFAPYFQYTLNDGGTQGRKYTFNFKYEDSIAGESISENGQAVFIFAVYVTARNDKYFPVNLDFSIQYEGGFELEHTKSDFAVPHELYGKMAEKLTEMKSLSLEQFMALYSFTGNEEECENAYVALQALPLADMKNGLLLNDFLNNHLVLRNEAEKYLKDYFNSFYDDTKGKTWRNSATIVNGKTVFLGTSYKYNPDTGFYHKYDENLYNEYGPGYGPILYADISRDDGLRTGVLDTAFAFVEYRGNKALTVSNGKENYKFFIESYASAQSMSQSVLGGPIDCPNEYINLIGYASIINSDCAVPVTEELRQFLQKYSISQLLFKDGDGWAETGTPPYEATENDQWLFACGYYE